MFGCLNLVIWGSKVAPNATGKQALAQEECRISATGCYAILRVC